MRLNIEIYGIFESKSNFSLIVNAPRPLVNMKQNLQCYIYRKYTAWHRLVVWAAEPTFCLLQYFKSNHKSSGNRRFTNLAMLKHLYHLPSSLQLATIECSKKISIHRQTESSSILDATKHLLGTNAIRLSYVFGSTTTVNLRNRGLLPYNNNFLEIHFAALSRCLNRFTVRKRFSSPHR